MFTNLLEIIVRVCKSMKSIETLAMEKVVGTAIFNGSHLMQIRKGTEETGKIVICTDLKSLVETWTRAP